MLSGFKKAAMLGGVGLLAGCAAQTVDEARQMSLSGAPFDKLLYAEYVQLARDELAEQDFRDANFFAERAKSAGGGMRFDPQDLNARDLPDAAVAPIAAARAALMAKLPAGRDLAPAAAARAQAALDCWLQEQEENFQPDDISACQNRFDLALAQLDAALKPKPAPAPVAAAPAPMPEAAPVIPKPAPFAPVAVYFAFDSAVLDDTAKATLIDAAARIMARDAKAVMIRGHTDTKGSAAYNLALAEKRVAAVSAFLAANGVAKKLFATTVMGENGLPMATGDEVAEAANRVVFVRVSP